MHTGNWCILRAATQTHSAFLADKETHTHITFGYLNVTEYQIALFIRSKEAFLFIYTRTKELYVREATTTQHPFTKFTLN